MFRMLFISSGSVPFFIFNVNIIFKTTRQIVGYWRLCLARNNESWTPKHWPLCDKIPKSRVLVYMPLFLCILKTPKCVLRQTMIRCRFPLKGTGKDLLIVDSRPRFSINIDLKIKKNFLLNHVYLLTCLSTKYLVRCIGPS